MTKSRLKEICKEFINHLHESTNDWDEVYNILSAGIGLTDNEIDELSGNFGQDEFEEDEDDENLF